MQTMSRIFVKFFVASVGWNYVYLRILELVGHNKTGNVHINIALIRVLVTVVDVEKQ
jgi:hypothetical protein